MSQHEKIHTFFKKGQVLQVSFKASLLPLASKASFPQDRVAGSPPALGTRGQGRQTIAMAAIDDVIAQVGKVGGVINFVSIIAFTYIPSI